VQRDADLLEVVAALRACRRLARLLHRRHQEADQDRDDRDHDEQFNQGEADAPGSLRHLKASDPDRLGESSGRSGVVQ
jgi:hypothetical protein